jgi:Ni/Co efflux regulator RcnB
LEALAGDTIKEFAREDNDMRKVVAAILAVVTIASSLTLDVTSASARKNNGYNNSRYYDNGRWVGERRWDRDRDRWARRHRGGNNAGAAAAAGVIGLALGAAIVGSTQDRDRGRYADRDYEDRCARQYDRYDRNSDTYLGPDGYRHYC